MRRTFILTYSLVTYLFFFVTFCYLVAFVGDWFVPKSINIGGATASWPRAAAINAGLLVLFGVQHTIMARPAFKRWITRWIPAAAERTTFVLVATALLAVWMWQWRPLPQVMWSVDAPIVRGLLAGISLAGWALALFSTFVIDHFDLFGVAQAWRNFHGAPTPAPHFQERSVYRMVRHPLMLGFIIAFWAAPTMTLGRLIFAALLTSHALLGIRFEERDLRRALGRAYADYQARVPMLLPSLRRRPRPAELVADQVPTDSTHLWVASADLPASRS